MAVGEQPKLRFGLEAIIKPRHALQRLAQDSLQLRLIGRESCWVAVWQGGGCCFLPQRIG